MLHGAGVEDRVGNQSVSTHCGKYRASAKTAVAAAFANTCNSGAITKTMTVVASVSTSDSRTSTQTAVVARSASTQDSGANAKTVAT